jgi:signal peptidase I
MKINMELVSKIKTILWEIVETFAVSFIVIYLIYQFVASMEVVYGSSMEPNFETGERILVDKISPYFKPYARGDIIVLIPPTEDTKHYIKRIIGLPGDIIKIYDCKVFITNSAGQFELSEDYLSDDTCTNGGMLLKEGRSVRLKDGEFVVLGDNRDHSVDSRFFGVVTPKNILGRVIFRFWPATRVGFL